MKKELIERNLLLSKISGRYDEKHGIVPDNLAEGFVQVEKLIKEQPVAFKVDEMLNYLADQKAHNGYSGQPKCDLERRGICSLTSTGYFCFLG